MGLFKAHDLHVWSQTLQHIVNGDLVCTYDIKNLDYSGHLLLASLSKSYKYTVLEELGPSPNDLNVFAYIVQTRLIKALSRQCESINKLSSLKLSDQEGENVRKFNVKLWDCCREIEQTGPPPRDLAFMVTCPIFQVKFLSSQLTYGIFN